MSEAKKTTFYSKFPGYKLTRIPVKHLFAQDGSSLGTSGPEPGESPWSVEFNGPIFETSDPVLIEFLRNHDEFNLNIWEEGNAPDEPRPTAKEQHQRIVDAAVDLDGDALLDLLESERATHNRAPIIQAAEAALERIEGSAGSDGSTGNDEDNESEGDSGSSDSDPQTE